MHCRTCTIDQQEWDRVSSSLQAVAIRDALVEVAAEMASQNLTLVPPTSCIALSPSLTLHSSMSLLCRLLSHLEESSLQIALSLCAQPSYTTAKQPPITQQLVRNTCNYRFTTNIQTTKTNLSKRRSRLASQEFTNTNPAKNAIPSRCTKPILLQQLVQLATWLLLTDNTPKHERERRGAFAAGPILALLQPRSSLVVF